MRLRWYPAELAATEGALAETRKLIEREVEKSVRVERLNQELPGCVRAEVARAQALAAARVEGFEGVQIGYLLEFVQPSSSADQTARVLII